MTSPTACYYKTDSMNTTGTASYLMKVAANAQDMMMDPGSNTGYVPPPTNVKRTTVNQPISTGKTKSNLGNNTIPTPSDSPVNQDWKGVPEFDTLLANKNEDGVGYRITPVTHRSDGSYRAGFPNGAESLVYPVSELPSAWGAPAPNGRYVVGAPDYTHPVYRELRLTDAQRRYGTDIPLDSIHRAINEEYPNFSELSADEQQGIREEHYKNWSESQVPWRQYQAFNPGEAYRKGGYNPAAMLFRPVRDSTLLGFVPETEQSRAVDEVMQNINPAMYDTVSSLLLGASTLGLGSMALHPIRTAKGLFVDTPVAAYNTVRHPLQTATAWGTAAKEGISSTVNTGKQLARTAKSVGSKAVDAVAQSAKSVPTHPLTRKSLGVAGRLGSKALSVLGSTPMVALEAIFTPTQMGDAEWHEPSYTVDYGGPHNPFTASHSGSLQRGATDYAPWMRGADPRISPVYSVPQEELRNFYNERANAYKVNPANPGDMEQVLVQDVMNYAGNRQREMFDKIRSTQNGRL